MALQKIKKILLPAAIVIGLLAVAYFFIVKPSIDPTMSTVFHLSPVLLRGNTFKFLNSDIFAVAVFGGLIALFLCRLFSSGMNGKRLRLLFFALFAGLFNWWFITYPANKSVTKMVWNAFFSLPFANDIFVALCVALLIVLFQKKVN